ncbi:hypothetical protein EUGRSUZ_B01848 [Eucalyptus grandis]|uniref:Uncharacterized protein n=2 Tax=Eucalyptus grandis TaxID=71139 RepID=A0ACC3LRE7_EUCGR|nr:hypothetical protein EUGRSUZ_B01848 [Eucalyptus grandis]
MATHSVHQKSSGDRPIRTKGNRPPPPLSPGDLISALPDAVIHHIFSFLPLKDVVKTSVLSKRWRCTWTSTAHLAFNGVRPRNHDAFYFDFPSLVDSVLRQCTSPTDLCLSLITERWSMYILPPSLYCWSWLVRLEVSLCCFSLDLTVCWPCLKVLSMEYAKLSDDFPRRILRESPVLESLQLRQCWHITNVIIDSTSVKDLLLIGANNCLLEKIWAPHLLSLRVSGMWKRRIFTLDDVSSLVKADLVFSIQTFSPGDKSMCYDVMKELFEKVHRVPIITIGGWCLKVLSFFEMKGVPSPLSKCQNLTLHTPITQRDLPGIAYMLGSSEFLEKLTIHLNGLHVFKYMFDKEWKDHFNYDEEDFLFSRKGNFQCLEKHLKSIEIIGFKANSFGSKHLHALIKFLLGDTLVLEKMIIKADLHSRKGQKNHQAAVLSKLFGVIRNVLSYQKASKNAEVIFDYPF